MPRDYPYQYGPFSSVAHAASAERQVKEQLALAKGRKLRGDSDGAADVTGWSNELAHIQQEKARLKQEAYRRACGH
ncbi:hypothetical protein OG875_04945 [Streptomyces sp. NBC_01498]|uniref:hypothetical protein n=1 Tax=Streptomyces sp. NBC_01498 TaxID=2975870 RepID=UPI002E7B4861|nr:hypothetical protein [Streptomyces sp. NBC_01498]WTL24004.1 hypothetical protein OG875_04945 [Streptomyces sp. NBC_01498]